MGMRHEVGIATVAVLAAMGWVLPANAQSYNWSGLYVGLNAGVGSGSLDRTSTFPCGTTDLYCTISAADGAAIAAAGNVSKDSTSFVGGAQVGYNFQAGGLVFGVEADAQSLRLSASSSTRVNLTGAGWPVTVATSASSDWLVTARARLGFATSNLLIYVTGGFAFADVEVGNSFTDTTWPTAASSSKSSTRSGWTLGGGVEMALGSNWTLKGEYLYVDLGSVSTTATIAPSGYTANTLTTSTDLTAHVARAGINYKF